MKEKLIELVKNDNIEQLKTHGGLNCDKIYNEYKTKLKGNKKAREKYLKYKMKYLQLKKFLDNSKL